MDPMACYLRFVAAGEADDIDEARRAQADLCVWIRRGGAEPQWSPAQRIAFFSWNPRDARVYQRAESARGRRCSCVGEVRDANCPRHGHTKAEQARAAEMIARRMMRAD